MTFDSQQVQGVIFNNWIVISEVGESYFLPFLPLFLTILIPWFILHLSFPLPSYYINVWVDLDPLALR